MSDLMPRCYVGDLELTDYPFSLARNELDLGAGENVMTFVDALLRDGSIGMSDRTENRTLVVPLYVEGADLLELAENEATLIRACERARNTFTLDPGDGFAPATVFDTFRIQAVHVRDDDFEAALLRRWDLEIPAMPWARSPVAVTQTLVPSAVVPTVVDECTATTDWTVGAGQTRSTATYLGESVLYVTATSGIYGSPLKLTYTGTAPAGDYVAIVVRNAAGDNADLTVTLNGAAPEAIESVTLGTGTYLQCWFPNDGAPYEFGFQDPTLGGSTYNAVRVARMLTSADTGFGAVLSVQTEGSVRAVGSVTCERAADPIEWLFLYADPQLGAFSPRLASTWGSGRDGTYVVYAATTFLEGDVVVVSFTDAAGRVVSTLPTRVDAEVAGMSWQPLGQVQLGGFRSGLIGDQTVAVTVDGVGVSTPSLRLFRLAEESTLVFLDDISGTEVVVQAPSVDYPVGGVWVDDVSTGPVVPGFPVVVVPSTALFVEANDSDTSPVASTLTYYPTSHTHNAYTP